MLKITNELIEYLNVNNTSISIVLAYINNILKIGNIDDAEAMLEYYLKFPFGTNSSYLLKIFEKYGDLYYAEQIFNKVIHNQKLINENESEVLLTLSKLNYLPIKPILFEYIKIDQNEDYNLMKYSILGLLNFDCSDYTNEIQTLLDKYLSVISFEEFIPALVCKIPNYNDYLDKLYYYAENVNTSDMNSGILLGFSLCEEEGRKYFLKSLFNPNFEAYFNGSGTCFFAYQGMKNLNIQFSDIYKIIKQNNDTEFIDYSIDVLFSLLEKRIYDYEVNLVSFKELYTIFFKWETKTLSNNLIDLARKVEKEEEAYRLESIIELKMEEEILISNFK